MKHTLYRYMILGSVMGLMGCPPTQNNAKAPDQGETPEKDMATVEEDMSVEDMSGERDLGEQPEDMGEDLAPDMPVADVRCQSVSTSAKTLPLDDQSAGLTWSVACDEEIAAERVSVRRGEEAVACKAWTCSRLPGTGRVACECTCNETSIAPPPVDPTSQAATPAQLELLVDGEPVTQTTLRWHLTPDQVAALQESRAIALPEGAGTRSLGGGNGVYVEVLEGGVYGFATTFDEAEKAFSIGAFELGQIDYKAESDPINSGDAVDIIGFMEDGAKLTSGGVETNFWAYNEKERSIHGGALQLGPMGDVVSKKAYDVSLDTLGLGPLQKVIDVIERPVRRKADTSDELIDGLSPMILAVQNDQITLLEPFAEDPEQIVEFTAPMLFGRTAQDISSKTFGIVKQPGSLEDFYDDGNDEYFYLWSADLKDNGEVVLSFIPTHTGVAVTRVFTSSNPVDEVRVDQIRPGVFGVTLLSKDNPPEYLLPVDPNSPTAEPFLEPDSTVNPLPPFPPGWNGSNLTLWDGGSSPVFTQVGDEIHMYGRWPWNWRDLKEQRTIDVVMRWDAETFAPLGLQPMIDEVYVPAELEPGDHVLLGGFEGLDVASVHARSLEPGFCDTPEGSCDVNVTYHGRDGGGVWVRNWQQGLALSTGLGEDATPLRGDFELNGLPVLAELGGEDGSLVLAAVVGEQARFAAWPIETLGAPRGSATVLSLDNADAKPVFAAGVKLHQAALTGDGALALLTEDLAGVFSVSTVSLADLDAAMVAGGEQSLVVTAHIALPEVPGIEGDTPQVALMAGGFDNIVRDVPEGNVVARLDESQSKRLHVVHRVIADSCDVLAVSVLEQGALREIARLEREGVSCARQYIIEQLTQGADGDHLVLHSLDGVTLEHLVRTERDGVQHMELLGQVAFDDVQDASFGDFNGDGIQDLVVDTGMNGGMTLVYFADGMGGYLAEPLPVVAGPTSVWIGNSNTIQYAKNPGAKKRIRQNAVRRLRNRYRVH